MAKSVSTICLIGLLAGVSARSVESAKPADSDDSLAEIVQLLPASFDSKLRRAGTVSFPIEISLDELQALVNDKAPESFDKDKKNQKLTPVMKDGWMEYHIDRGEIRLTPLSTVSGDVLGFDIPLKGNISAGGKFLHLMPATVGLEFRGSVIGSVRAGLNPDWSPDVQVAFDADLDKASIKLFHSISFPIKDHLNKELDNREPDIEKKLLKQLDLLNLPKRIEPYWAQLYKTIRLSKNPPAWIQIKPHSLALTPFSFAPNRMIVFNAAVEVEAVTFLGEKPKDQEVGPLPQVMRLKDAVKSFKIAVPSYVSLSTVGDFIGTKFLPAKVDVTQDVSVTFLKLALDCKGGVVTCAVKAEAHGGVFGEKMPINLSATTVPRLNADKRELHFENLKYTVETENFLAQSASVLLQPVVLAKLQEKTRFAFGDLLVKSRDKINEIMVDKKAGKHLEVNVHFDKMEVCELAVLNGQVVILSDAEGALGLRVHPYRANEPETKNASIRAAPADADVTFRP